MQFQSVFENISLIIERCFSARNTFLFGSMLAAIVLTILFYIGVLPLSVEYFLFYSLLLFLACLARPSWMFLFFVAILPLEIVSVTPVDFGFDLRPYQWVGGFLGIAIGIRFVTGRLVQPFFRWHMVDTIFVILFSGIVFAGIVGQSVALKQTVVVGSFLFLYFLSRLFLRQWQDVKQALFFFLLSASLVLLWGISQNILFFLGYGHFSIMPGRPNGTLIEPDWLGLFCLFVLAPALWWLKERLTDRFSLKALLLPLSFLLLIFTTLIITVSRSAWIGAVVLLGSFLVLVFYEKNKGFAFRPALLSIECLIVVFGVALVLVETVPLTRFALIDRAGSVASQYQTITIVCDGTMTPPQYIETGETLSQYGCQHILLEEKEARLAEGKIVTTTKRPDPNVNIRKAIYETSLGEIKDHPVVGIGWGNIGPKLGLDERGASYNASNLFLELWLGGGIVALMAFIMFVGGVLFMSYRMWKRAVVSPFAAPLLAILAGFLVFNLFNTGLLLGFVWVWFALFPLLFPSRSENIA